jgi:hypothetical protein
MKEEKRKKHKKHRKHKKHKKEKKSKKEEKSKKRKRDKDKDRDRTKERQRKIQSDSDSVSDRDSDSDSDSDRDIGKKTNHQVDPEKQKAKKQSKLVHAIQEGTHSDVLYRIFCGGADMNAHATDTGNTPLHVACARGSAEIAAVLLEHGAQVSAANKQGMTGLHISVMKEFGELAKLLIKHGASAHTEDAQGVSAAAMGLDLLLQGHERSERDAFAEREEQLREKMKDDQKEEEYEKAKDRDLLWQEKMQSEMEYEQGYYGDRTFGDEWEGDEINQDGRMPGDDWMEDIIQERKQKAQAYFQAKQKQREEYNAANEDRHEGEADSDTRRRKRQKQAGFNGGAGQGPFAWQRGGSDNSNNSNNRNGTNTSVPPVVQETAEQKKLRLKTAYDKDEAEWKMFTDLPVEVRINFLDVPWPSGEDENILNLDLELDQPQLKKLIRTAQLRWHPDKFVQKWGQRLVVDDGSSSSSSSSSSSGSSSSSSSSSSDSSSSTEACGDKEGSEQEQILARVKHVAQCINTLKDSVGV